MRRSLVLTQEGARHSFRAKLPTPVGFRGRDRAVPPRAATLSWADARGVVNTYVAAVAAVLAFIM